MSLLELRKMFEPLNRRMKLMVGRCVLNSAEDNGILTGQVAGLEDETLEKVERLENYGLAGHPPAGSEGAMLCVGGARDHPLMVGMEHREHRPSMAEEGEIKLYSMFKQFIHLDKDGNIRIKAPKGVYIEAESFTATLEEDTTFQSRNFSSSTDKNTTFQSQNFHSNAADDIALTSDRFGVAARESAIVDSGLHTTREITAERDITSHREVRDHKSTMQGMRDIYNPHTHRGCHGQEPGQDM